MKYVISLVLILMASGCAHVGQGKFSEGFTRGWNANANRSQSTTTYCNTHDYGNSVVQTYCHQ